MDFGTALGLLKSGYKVARTGWGAPGDVAQFIALQVPDEGSKMTVPYLYLGRIDGSVLTPWSPMPGDILSSDWRMV